MTLTALELKQLIEQRLQDGAINHDSKVRLASFRPDEPHYASIAVPSSEEGDAAPDLYIISL